MTRFRNKDKKENIEIVSDPDYKLQTTEWMVKHVSIFHSDETALARKQVF